MREGCTRFPSEMTAVVRHGQHTPGQGLLSNSEWRGIARSLSLSQREFDIARAIFDDASEETIARELKISRNTVHTHFTRLYRKLHVSSRVEAVVRIMNEHRQLSEMNH